YEAPVATYVIETAYPDWLMQSLQRLPGFVVQSVSPDSRTIRLQLASTHAAQEVAAVPPVEIVPGATVVTPRPASSARAFWVWMGFCALLLGAILVLAAVISSRNHGSGSTAQVFATPVARSAGAGITPTPGASPAARLASSTATPGPAGAIA